MLILRVIETFRFRILMNWTNGTVRYNQWRIKYNSFHLSEPCVHLWVSVRVSPNFSLPAMTHWKVELTGWAFFIHSLIQSNWCKFTFYAEPLSSRSLQARIRRNEYRKLWGLLVHFSMRRAWSNFWCWIFKWEVYSWNVDKRVDNDSLKFSLTSDIDDSHDKNTHIEQLKE